MEQKELTKNYYNAIAKGYDELYGEEQKEKLNTIKDYLPEKGDVLDAGSGTGVSKQFLNKSVNITAIDISEELLNLNPIEKKIIGDVENMPFEKNQFDHIICLTVLQDVNDKQKAINELSRVLKTNGTLFISFLKNSKFKDEIINELESKFKIIHKIEEKIDLIIIAKNTTPYPSS